MTESRAPKPSPIGEVWELDGKPVTVLDVKPSGTVIEDINTHERWPGIKFKVRPVEGGRAFWTCTYPDREPL